MSGSTLYLSAIFFSTFFAFLVWTVLTTVGVFWKLSMEPVLSRQYQRAAEGLPLRMRLAMGGRDPRWSWQPAVIIRLTILQVWIYFRFPGIFLHRGFTVVPGVEHAEYFIGRSLTDSEKAALRRCWAIKARHQRQNALQIDRRAWLTLSVAGVTWIASCIATLNILQAP